MISQDKIKSFKDLVAWQEAHKLALEVYSLTKKIPNEEKFGLVGQIRRAALSVSSNIAEGFSRGSTKEKIQFYRTALGSLAETHNQLILSRDLSFIVLEEFDHVEKEVEYVGKLVTGLIKSAGSLNKNKE